jgi:hypothetical protein
VFSRAASALSHQPLTSAFTRIPPQSSGAYQPTSSSANSLRVSLEVPQLQSPPVPLAHKYRRTVHPYLCVAKSTHALKLRFLTVLDGGPP